MPIPDPVKLEERFILCEGSNDKEFLEGVIYQRGLGPFQVKQSSELTKDGKTGGRPAFTLAFEGFHVYTGFSRLKGVLIVTDNDHNGAFPETQKALEDNGYTPPATPKELGNINGKPVRVLLIPSDDAFGDLESLCLPVVLAKWPQAEECATEFVKCTGAANWEKEQERRKAFLRSIIVGCNEADPYNGLGILFSRGILDANHECIKPVFDVLSRFDAIMQGN